MLVRNGDKNAMNINTKKLKHILTMIKCWTIGFIYHKGAESSCSGTVCIFLVKINVHEYIQSQI